jgi:hypothetical protein
MPKRISKISAGTFLFGVWSIVLACGPLDDPNLPNCMSGASAKLTAVTTQQPVISNRDDLRSGPIGIGQMVCAFYDQRTQKCLTERPNTTAYDSAVQTGVETAMMGMQIQQDALHRARMMGISGAKPTQGYSQPNSQQPVLPFLPAQPNPFSVTSPAANQMTTTSPIEDTAQKRFKECFASRLEQIQMTTGRPASPEQTTAAMRGCSR